MCVCVCVWGCVGVGDSVCVWVESGTTWDTGTDTVLRSDTHSNGT